MGHEVLVIVPEHKAIPAEDYPFPVQAILFDNGQNGNEAEVAFNFPTFTTHPRSVQTFYDLTDAQMVSYVDVWRAHIGQARRLRLLRPQSAIDGAPGSPVSRLLRPG